MAAISSELLEVPAVRKYVESQRAGTLVDDPIELGALSATLRDGQQPDNTLPE
jgi:acyl transferase domain-containing protein